MEKLDYKKEYKELYQPPNKPGIVDIPEMTFITVDGRGDPNEENGEYRKAVELLYALAFTIKMSIRGNQVPDGYFEYVVPPLEGLWWLEGGATVDFRQKEKYCWTSLIRQPAFVTPAIFEWACHEAAGKKQLDVSKAKLETFSEGLCVQMMHFGPYDDEPASIARMETFSRENGLRNAIGDVRPDGRICRHHEIYLSDPRKTAPEKTRTVLRHPVEYV